MTEKNLNILLVAGTMLVISLGCFFYLRPVSYRSVEKNDNYQPSTPLIEDSSSDSNSPAQEPITVDLSPLINAIGQLGTSTETSTAQEQKEAEGKDTKQACLISGGRIAASLCCKSAGDFPNSCLIGACGCSPDDSKATMICECGEGKCFDGTECVTLD